MASSSGITNTAVVYNPSNTTSPLGSYNITGYTLQSIIPSPISGISSFALNQSALGTEITWQQTAGGVYGPVFAEPSLSGSTYIMWAIGSSAALSDSPLPAMGSTLIYLNPEVSPSASPSAVPSPLVYSNTTSLSRKNGLSLSWNFDGDTYYFKAVLTRLAW